MLFSRLMLLLVLASGLASGLAGCQDDPVSPAGTTSAPPPVLRVAGSLPDGPPGETWPAGPSRWRWTLLTGQPDQLAGPRGGTALLETWPPPPEGTAAGRYSWLFQPPVPSLAEELVLALVPADTAAWLSLVTRPEQWPSGGPPLPLPRWALNSPHYPHLAAFLRDLTAPLFLGRVRHWPRLPVPVRAGQAQSGEVDLAACLAEAVAIWNAGEAAPWFRLDPEAAWGVRLVHFPGAVLHPPLRARLTRLDDEGRPLRVDIIAGSNYDHARDRPYALRAMVHELGHALLLWGHSSDRDHVLWESGPPQVEIPSPDERKAAHLWHGLPEGLDLNAYFSGPAARTEPWPPGDRP